MNPFFTTTDDATSLISALAVTPNDNVDLVPPTGPARPTRALIIGGAGTLKVTFADGSVVTLTVPVGVVGFVQYLSVTRIWATGTAATLITALY